MEDNVISALHKTSLCKGMINDRLTTSVVNRLLGNRGE